MVASKGMDQEDPPQVRIATNDEIQYENEQAWELVAGTSGNCTVDLQHNIHACA